MATPDPYRVAGPDIAAPGVLPPVPPVVRGRRLGAPRPPSPLDPTPRAGPDGPSTTRDVLQWTAVVAGALVVALIVKLLLFQAFMIPSESMVPTLKIGDRVLVNKLSYQLHDVDRGDLVVFHRPPAAQSPGDDSDLIKRVVGLPGETVEGRGGVVLVDGQSIPESYLPAGVSTGEFPRITLGNDQVWVMGDNRGNSRDSRVFGPLDESYIIGRAFARVWPPGALELF